MDPITFFGLIGSVCSIASYLSSINQEASSNNINDYISDIPEKYREDIISDEGIAFINLLIIDNELLNDLIKDVQVSENAYRDCLRIARGQRSQVRDGCDRKAERLICETLNRVMDRNDSVLPTEFLKARWISYQCARF